MPRERGGGNKQLPLDPRTNWPTKTPGGANTKTWKTSARQLREFCQAQGWGVVAEYADEESGPKSDRARFKSIWHDAAKRRFDVLLFWVLDGFSREGVLETLTYLATPHVLRDQLAITHGIVPRLMRRAPRRGARDPRSHREAGTHPNQRADSRRARTAPAKGTRTGRPIGKPPPGIPPRSGSWNFAGTCCPGVRLLSRCTPAPRR